MTDARSDNAAWEGTALVTGGGSGIGLACAQQLARAGLRVTISGRSQERLDQALTELPDNAAAVSADITDPEAMATAVEIASDDDGGLSVVVANAGAAFAVGPLALVRPADFAKELEVNVTGTFITLQAAAPAMAKAGASSFVAVSSIAGILTHPNMAAYGVAKAGLEMLVRNAADELGRFGVRVNGVRPGLVPTGASDPLVTNDATRQDYLDQMPLGRLGQVEDIAEVVTFFASPASSWITGQIISADGGHSLRRGPNIEGLLGDGLEKVVTSHLLG